MEKAKKYTRLAVIFVIVLISIICLRCILAKKPLFLLGHSFFIVSSASMEPEYSVCTLVAIKQVPFEELKVGDVVVYRSNALGGKLAFHRIIRFTNNGFYTKGDNNSHEDNQLIVKNTYVGKGISQSYSLGVYISAIQHPAGFVLFLVTPLFLLSVFICALKRLIKKQK